jgi:hypothetical protein
LARQALPKSDDICFKVPVIPRCALAQRQGISLLMAPCDTLGRSLDDVRTTHIEGRHFTLKSDDIYFKIDLFTLRRSLDAVRDTHSEGRHIL